jgi:hypothetical protein
LGYDPGDLVVGVDGNSLSGFRFYGNVLPNTPVNLYIFSKLLFKSTTSDSKGAWSIKINEPLATGNHNAYAVMVVNGVETKHSNVVAFSVDSVSKAVALGFNSITVKPTVSEKPGTDLKVTLTPSPMPKTTDTSSGFVWLVIILFVVIAGIACYVVVSKKKKQNLINNQGVTGPINPE